MEIEVTGDMFNNLKNTVSINRDEAINANEKNSKSIGQLDERVTELESQIDILKSMSSNDDGSPGIFDMI